MTNFAQSTSAFFKRSVQLPKIAPPTLKAPTFKIPSSLKNGCVEVGKSAGKRIHNTFKNVSSLNKEACNHLLAKLKRGQRTPPAQDTGKKYPDELTQNILMGILDLMPIIDSDKKAPFVDKFMKASESEQQQMLKDLNKLHEVLKNTNGDQEKIGENFFLVFNLLGKLGL